MVIQIRLTAAVSMRRHGEVGTIELGAWGWPAESREPWSEDASQNLNPLGRQWFRMAPWRPYGWGGAVKMVPMNWVLEHDRLRAKNHDLKNPVEVLNLRHSTITTVTSPLLPCYFMQCSSQYVSFLDQIEVWSIFLYKEARGKEKMLYTFYVKLLLIETLNVYTVSKQRIQIWTPNSLDAIHCK